ncbi:hypothetical protein BDA99DRAFT_542045 [Phascolomyces articulosus]|uniref:F-box domain-containing protein n=1 Tax=Phascolomyces articulosus TaxID=60185 RepID=A0AAD5P9E2_9FUNG|nr:hypothetical protein BDA99DRAFT_542045 [Phascolomyces articulosus]
MTVTETTTKFQTSPCLTSYQDPYTHFTSTQLDLTLLQNAFDQGKQAYTSHDYEYAIEFYTNALNILHQDIQSFILLHRSAAYEKSQQYQKALDDCAQVEDNDQKQLLPRPDTYWMRANVLLQQGNAREAADIYKKGADTISHQTYSQQKQQLMKQYNHLMKEINYHNQTLICRLPHEIISKILTCLYWREHGQLALTCRFWYKFILQEWSGMGSCIDAVSDYDHPRLPPIQLPGHHHLTQYLQHVRSHRVKTVLLHLCTEDREAKATSEAVFRNLIRNRWNKIETLEITPYNNQQLRQILLLNKGSIKRLQLKQSYDGDPSAFVRIDGLTDATQICTSIHTIVYKTVGYIDVFQNITTTLTLPNWSVVDLSLSSEVLTADSLAQILNRTPFLTSLDITYESFDVRMMQTIYKHAPQLQHLAFSNYPAEDDSSTTYSRSRNEHSTHVGLKSLDIFMVFHPYISHSNPSEIVGLFLKRSHRSLESLKIYNENHHSTHKELAVLAECGAPNLRTLHLMSKTNTVMPSPPVLSRLLLVCPALKDVQFDCGYIWSDSTYQALGKLSQLTHLCLAVKNLDLMDDPDEFCSSFGIQQPSIFRHNIHELSTPKGASALFEHTKSLWSFKIDDYQERESKDVDRLMMKLVQYIGRCSSLRRLDIRSVNFNNEQLVTFLKSIKDSSIHTLKIQTPSRPVTEKELKVLASLPSVRHLFIVDRGKDLGENFSKARLFRLFQEHQMDHPFIVDVDGPLTMRGWKRPLSCASESLINHDKVVCLHSIYSIWESNYNYYTVDEDDYFEFNNIINDGECIVKNVDVIMDYKQDMLM